MHDSDYPYREIDDVILSARIWARRIPVFVWGVGGLKDRTAECGKPIVVFARKGKYRDSSLALRMTFRLAAHPLALPRVAIAISCRCVSLRQPVPPTDQKQIPSGNDRKKNEEPMDIFKTRRLRLTPLGIGLGS